MVLAHMGDEVWHGIRNKYWRWPWYFLPVCVNEGFDEMQE